MATLKQYFDTDFNDLLSCQKSVSITKNGASTEIILKLHMDFNAGTKFVSCYLPVLPDISDACQAVLNNVNFALSMSDSVTVKTSFPGEDRFINSELLFSGRLFIYSESELSDAEKQELKARAERHGIALKFRTAQFATGRSKFEKPLAFICHDSRDKDAARLIAIGLMKFPCPVWYDEYSLMVGDSLRVSIEKGIRECKKCVLILSPNFFTNNGWTKKEFDSIYTREIVEESRVILPVWKDVSREQVYEYSPSLPDTFAVQWSSGVETVCQQLYRVLSAGSGPFG